MNPSVTGVSPEATYSKPTAEPSGASETMRATAQAVDEVKLSTEAQAKSLRNLGETVTQIAQELGCTTNQIDTYLGITEDTDTPPTNTGSH